MEVNIKASPFCMLCNYPNFCCRLLTFKIPFSKKDLSGILSECQTVRIQIRTDILLVLIWVQTVCKVNQMTPHFAFWVIFNAFVVVCLLFLITFKKKSFRNTIRVSNGLDQDHDQYSVGPDLGPNCLQSLSADYKSHLLKYMNQYQAPGSYNFFSCST